MGAKRATPRERFDRFVSPEPNTGCWLWTGSVDHRGYGWLRVDGAATKAHRWIFAATNGPIPEGMFVCHRCDTPACVNPVHLFLGSSAANVADMISKHRQAVGIRLPQHKMTEADVVEARRLHAAGGVSARSLARRFGITHMPMQSLLNGKTWKHLLTEARHRVHS